MANTSATFGFRHIGYLPGFITDAQLATRLISSGYTTAIYNGDPVVKLTGTQYIGQASSNSVVLEGVFQGCEYPQTNGSVTWSAYWPGSGASGDVTAYLINAPGAIFLAAALNTTIASTAIGENVGFATGTGSTFTGLSGFTVDQSTLSTTNTLPFQVVGPYAGIGNGSDLTTAYGWTQVTFNNQRFKQLTGTA